MKIISKHKDYYDYLAGVYGIDEKMVYDRRTGALEKPLEDIISPINKSTLTTHTFSICNRTCIVFQFENAFYHTIEDFFELYEILKDKNIYIPFPTYSWRGKLEEQLEDYYKNINCDSDINKAIRQPVLIQTNFEGNSFTFEGKYSKTFWRVPELSKFGFPKWYPAEEMYQQIVAFIGWLKDNPEIPNNQTNEEKIQSNGFDLKTSFRHRK